MDLVNVATSAQRWIALRTNLTASTITVFTDQEKFAGAFAAPASAANVWLGGSAARVSAGGHAYAAQFTGPAAELPDAQVKKLLQTLGATVPWT